MMVRKAGLGRRVELHKLWVWCLLPWLVACTSVPSRSEEPGGEPSVTPEVRFEVERRDAGGESAMPDAGGEALMPDAVGEMVLPDAAEPPEGSPEAPDTPEVVGEPGPEPIPAKPWVFSASHAEGWVNSHRIATDGQGSVYIYGTFGSKASFDTTLLETTETTGAIFVAKLSADGVLQWVHKLDGKGQKTPRTLQVDGQGNVFVSGTYAQELRLAGKTLQAPAGGGDFLAKLDTMGQLQWLLPVEGYLSTQPLVTPQGDFYLAGQFSKVGKIGTHALQSQHDFDIFVAKLDKQAKVLWSQVWSGPGFNALSDPALDRQGNLRLRGLFEQTLQVGANTYRSQKSDVLVARLDPSGKLMWFKHSAGPGRVTHSGHGAHDANDALFLWGKFEGDKTFGSVALKAATGEQLFLAFFKPDGSAAWALQSTGQSTTTAAGAATTPQGTVYLYGEFEGKLQLGNTTLDSPSHGSIYLAHARADGTYAWVKRSESFAHLHPYAMAVSASGRAYLTGEYTGRPKFGGTTLRATTIFQSYIVRCDPQGNFDWGVSTRGAYEVNARQIATDAGGNVVIAGAFKGKATFDTLDETPKGSPALFVWKAIPPP